MALIVKDRVKQTAAAPGTGTITLGSTPTGFQSFAAVGDTNTTYFAIVDPASGAWEVNYGVYASSGTTLTRNATPLSSSNSGSLVNFTGAVDVFVTYPSEKAVYEDTAGVVTFTDNPILSAGTANGVLYLNGSKAATSGSALVFDGTNLGVGETSPSFRISIKGDTSVKSGMNFKNTVQNQELQIGCSSATTDSFFLTTSNSPIYFGTNNTEGLRLTNTSLYTASTVNVGIGNNNPQSKLHIQSAVNTSETLITLQTGWSSPSGNKSIAWTDGSGRLGAIGVNYTAPQGAMTFGSLYNSGYNTTDLMTLTPGSLYTADPVYVGIGISSPLDKLDVVSASATYRNRIRNSGANEATLLFQNSSTGTATNDGLYLGIVGSMDGYLWNYENSPIIFGTNNTERISITATGIFKKSSTNGGLQLMDGNTAGGVKIGAYTANFLANGYLAFEGYSIEYGRFDSSGNLCVGSSSAGNAASVNISVGSPATTTGGLQLWSTTTGTHWVQFGDGTTGADPYRGAVGYLHASDAMSFYTASAEQMRISSAGNVNIINGSLAIGYSGAPAANLDVRGSGVVAQYLISSSAGPQQNQIVSLYNGGGAYGPLNIDGSVVQFKTSGTTVATVSSTGLAVTGTGTFTGAVSIGTSSAATKLNVYVPSSTEPVLTLGGADGIGKITGVRIGYGEGGSYCKSAILFENTDPSYATGSLHLCVDSVQDSGNAVLADSKLTINSSGYVGIGTTAPASTLQVGVGGPRETTASFFGTGSQVASSISTVGIYSTNTATVGVGAALTLGGQTGNAVGTYPFGIIQGAKNSATAGDYGGYLQFNTIPANGGSPVPNLTLTTGGGVQAYNTISVGAAGPATSGAGITFPATQSASSDANTLDDYEEGFFTATVAPLTSGTITLYSTVDKLAYTKIGRVVYVQGLLEISSVSSPVGTVVKIQNLPFACADLDEYAGRIGTAFPVKGLVRGVYMYENNTVVEVDIDSSTMVTGDQFYVSFNYIAA